MRTASIKASLKWLLALTLTLGALLPAVAQAAPSPSVAQKHPVMQWSPATRDYTFRRGAREFVISAAFRSPVNLSRLSFAAHIAGPIYARDGVQTIGYASKNEWHAVTFVAVVPATTKDGWYHGSIDLLSHEGQRDWDGVGRDYNFRIHIYSEPQVTPIVNWTPANSLGNITLQQGQSITKTVTWTSSVALTNVQVQRELLSPYAANYGVSVTVLPSGIALPAVLPANTPINVSFVVSAAANTPIGVYPANLHVMGSVNNGPLMRLPQDLKFGIDVDHVAPVAAQITWSPVSPLTLQPGQTVTQTATFTSNAAINSAMLAAHLNEVLTDRGVTLTLLSPVGTQATIPANTPVVATFVVTALPTARPSVGVAVFSLTGLNSVGLTAEVPGVLTFPVAVVYPALGTVAWTPASPASFPSITRGTTTTVMVTESASFTSTATLVGAQLVVVLDNHSVQNGLTATPVALASTTVNANTPTPVSFAINVPATAKRGVYSGQVYVRAIPFGGSVPVSTHYALSFVFAVN